MPNGDDLLKRLSEMSDTELKEAGKLVRILVRRRETLRSMGGNIERQVQQRGGRQQHKKTA